MLQFWSYPKFFVMLLLAGMSLNLVYQGKLVADRLFFLTYNFVETSSVQPTNSAPQIQPENQQNNFSKEIAELNLFGDIEKVPSADELAVESLPSTDLQLNLKAIFASSSHRDSSAIIADKDQAPVRYFVNDRLPGNATLHAVFPDSVVIKRGTKLETLRYRQLSANTTTNNNSNSRNSTGLVTTSANQSNSPSSRVVVKKV